MGLNYPIIPQTRFSGRRDKTATPRERRASLARLDLGRDPGFDGGGWLRMRDGRSKTAPIINHRMIHSIVPSPSVRSSSKPDPGEKARAFSKEITSAAGRELASSLRRRQSITLGIPARSPRLTLPSLSLSFSLSHVRSSISLAANHPAHPLTLLNQPPLSSSSVRSSSSRRCRR